MNKYTPTPGILLSLDLSPTGTGYAVLNFNSNLHKPVAYGSILLSSPDVSITFKWLKALKEVRKLIREHKPEVIVFEKIEGTVYAMLGKSDFQTGTTLIKMVGAIESKADELGVPCRGFTPQQWKRYIGVQTGEGHPRKEQKASSIAFAKEFFKVMLIDDNAADALNLGRYYAEKFAMAELRQMRLL